jgi:hypothetical protein
MAAQEDPGPAPGIEVRTFRLAVNLGYADGVLPPGWLPFAASADAIGPIVYAYRLAGGDAGE